MIRQFFRDSVIYGFSSILARGISFFLLPLYARALSPHEYGMLDYVSMIGSFIAVFVALEISQGVARYSSDALENQKDLREYASTSLIFTICAYAFFLILAFLNQDTLSKILFGSEEHNNLITLAAASYCVSGTLYLIQGQLRWELKPMKHAIVSIAMSCLTAIMSILLILVLKLSVAGALWALIIAGSISAALALYYARESYGLSFNKQKLWQMLSFSTPLVISSVAAIGAIYIDRIFIKEIVGLEELGYYGVAWRISLIITLAMMGVQGALTPLVYSHHKDPESPASLEKIFRYFVSIAATLYLIICIFIPYYFAPLVGEAYMPAAPIVPVLCLAVLFSGMYIFAPGLGIEKKTKHITVVNVAGIILNTALNYIFVPIYGAMGAAGSTLASAIFIFVALLYLSQKYYPIPHNWKIILPAFILTTFAAYGSTYVASGIISDIAIRIVIFATTLALLFKIGLISSQERDNFFSFISSFIRNKSFEA